MPRQMTLSPKTRIHENVTTEIGIKRVTARYRKLIPNNRRVLKKPGLEFVDSSELEMKTRR